MQGEGAAEPDIEAIARDPRYIALVRRRSRFTWGLSAVMLVGYFGFILAVAFAKPLLARPIAAGGVTSWGIAIGFGVILLAIVLTGIYVRRANRDFDLVAADLARDFAA
ncbi:DUF485 domain-containing protein [Sphingomonas baiyangensis]|uniref:DUF485 domain-containing protein n=2 Tax=Sphingomonas baiyangensis TaxID=2572576 RepID=A0A4U1L5W5_9SPHN|nr:DUF485 domain-containing protein [Sphingomonas baiyangensis]